MFGKFGAKLKKFFTGKQKDDENPLLEEKTANKVDDVEEFEEESKEKPVVNIKKECREKQEQKKSEETVEPKKEQKTEKKKDAVKKSSVDSKKLEENKKNTIHVNEEKINLKHEQLDEIKQDTEELEETKASVEPKKRSGLFKKVITEANVDAYWEEIMVELLEMNVAYEVTELMKEAFIEKVLGNSLSRLGLGKALKQTMKETVREIFKKVEEKNELSITSSPTVIVMIGVNGTGKTTTIAKLIHYLQQQEKSVVVAASDTFRAAAIEQLEAHTTRLGVTLIQHQKGGDPAAVAYDAIQHARAKNKDVVIVDTAGRMPNNANLGKELEKICRVSHADEVIFVGDSSSGSDLLEQYERFSEYVKLTGVILTKVDTDEKPGSLITAAFYAQVPIYFVGTGQHAQDFEKFNAEKLLERLFEE